MTKLKSLFINEVINLNGNFIQLSCELEIACLFNVIVDLRRYDILVLKLVYLFLQILYKKTTTYPFFYTNFYYIL